MICLYAENIVEFCGGFFIVRELLPYSSIKRKSGSPSYSSFFPYSGYSFIFTFYIFFHSVFISISPTRHNTVNPKNSPIYNTKISVLFDLCKFLFKFFKIHLKISDNHYQKLFKCICFIYLNSTNNKFITLI